MKIRFMFLRDKRNVPVGCLAITVSSNMKEINYQYSVLNPVDGFNRSLARELAAGRLVTKPIVINSDLKFLGINDITRTVMLDIAFNSHAPTRAIKAAELWLDTPLEESEPRLRRLLA